MKGKKEIINAKNILIIIDKKTVLLILFRSLSIKIAFSRDNVDTAPTIAVAA